ncbi:hypothetical protein HB364_25465 [Pseudoflavitalea sp. X16]|uniref:hypothetical protein n=1 Tax=Paraflavitalea devenefica TaxID=2716334 RepID=UPI00141F61D0|nr:hypothetical protein [Paraflavitalea devenefica]NII28457.1 hypothetical protein [Paraflavitalea devenefica]
MKIRIGWLLAAGVLLLTSCVDQNESGQEAYRWVIFGTIPRKPGEDGKVAGIATWNEPLRITTRAADTFTICNNYDSIYISFPGNADAKLFKKVQIESKVWKARPNYGNLFFVGNYVTEGLPGYYISFYFTKDRSTSMQLHYTDPGNMNAVILFAKDSINILKEAGVIIDPRDELPEPQRINSHR